MRLLVVGLGSIGQRHVRNLRALLGAEAEIIACRSRRGHEGSAGETEDGIETHVDLDDALARRPAAVFVCNPTSLHVPVAIAAARAGCHLFVEKPVSDRRERLDELLGIVREKGLKTLVGFQFRFHPGLAAVRRLIASTAVGRVVHVAAHWGEYLPDWHPGEDYRAGYSARRDLGGGVILTLCHPFDYLRWMLGEVRAVTAIAGSHGDLGIDVEDTADVILEFRSGATASVHLDYVRRPPAHRLEVTGTEGTIIWDNATGEVRWYRADRSEWASIPAPAGFERNTLFLDEARHFLDCIAGTADPAVDLEEGIRTLEVTFAARSAAVEGRAVKVAA